MIRVIAGLLLTASIGYGLWLVFNKIDMGGTLEVVDMLLITLFLSGILAATDGKNSQ
jgi:hypothetical protein